MRKRTAAALLAFLLMALLAGLWWRRRQDDGPAASAGTTSAPVTTAAPAASTSSADPETAPAPADVARKLFGLRLITTEVATSRGWKPPPPKPEDSDPVSVARKRWQRTKVDFKSNDRTVGDVLAEVEKNFGLHVRVDADLSLEGRILCMHVGGMSGESTMQFIARTMKGIAFTIDAAGEAWFTTPERAALIAAPPEPPDTDPNRSTAGMIRWEIKMNRGPDGKWPATPIPDASWKGRKVTVAIVRQPVEEALIQLGEALGMRKPMRLAYFSKDATEKVGDAQPVSLVATDMPVEEAIDEILRGTGLKRDPDRGDTCAVRTVEDVEQRRALAESIRKQFAEEASETAGIRTRHVRIVGDVLTATEVALQVGSQLGVTVRIASEVALCPALWESDGLDQPAGEVLDILARDGTLLWRWQGEVDGASDLHVGSRCLWIVGSADE